MTAVSDETRPAESSGPSDHPAGTVVVSPPLWTPHDEQVFRRAALATPPVAIEGWSIQTRIMHFFFSSVRVTVVRVGMLISILFFIAAVPRLLDLSTGGNLWRVAWYHGWTLMVLVLVTGRVRAVPAHRLISFVLLGASVTAFTVFFVAGPLTDLVNSELPSVWVDPPLEETVKLATVAGILVGARRRLIQPGVVDFALIGFAVGAGFSFHEDALWDRVTTSGFESPWGLLFPSFFQTGGVFVVAHAAWTAITAMGLGLLVMHWRRPMWAVAGVVMMIVPVADHMSVNSRNGSFDGVVDVLFDHRLPAWLLLGGLIAAVVLDAAVLRSMARRDHLLTTTSSAIQNADPPAGQRTARRRFRRARNSIHFTRHRDRAVWPTPRPAPALTTLGRSAQAAGHPVGTRADQGWDLDPVDPDRVRWFTADGWTPYVVSPTGASIDPVPGRPELVGIARHDPSPNWKAMIAVFTSLVAAAIAVRILTVPEDGPGGIQFGSAPLGDRFGSSLSAAPNGPIGPLLGSGAAGTGGYGGSGPGDGSADGDPPPLPPDFFDGINGPPGPDETPPSDQPDEEECP